MQTNQRFFEGCHFRVHLLRVKLRKVLPGFMDHCKKFIEASVYDFVLICFSWEVHLFVEKREYDFFLACGIILMRVCINNWMFGLTSDAWWPSIAAAQASQYPRKFWRSSFGGSWRCNKIISYPRLNDEWAVKLHCIQSAREQFLEKQLTVDHIPV